MSIVIITGSNGLVGSESVQFFSKKGFDVIGIDNNLRQLFFGKEGSTLWKKKELIKNNRKSFTSLSIDIRNYNSLETVFKKYKKNISLVIHCAAQPSHDYAKNHPLLDFEVNAKGTLNMLELTKIYSPRSPFIFTSTNKVYGDNPNNLKLIEKAFRFEVPKVSAYYKGIDEKFPIDNCTHSFFGVSKTYADLIVQEYGKNVGLKTVSFRGGCITGPNHSGTKLHGFLSFLVKQCLNKKTYDIIGYNGKQVRDNIHSSDLVNCFWEFYKKPKYGEVYNIGGGRKSNCSILEAIEIIEKKTGLNVKRNYIKNNRVGDHIWYISNLDKFKKDYPKWSQKYNTNMIISELINKQNAIK